MVVAYIAAVEVDAAVSAVAIDDAASAEEGGVDAAAASPENVDDDMAHCSSAESADAAEAEAATAAGAEYCNGNTPAESKAAAVRKPPAAAAKARHHWTMPDCFARNCREMAEATIADRPAAAEAAVARYRRAVLPRGVESVEESSGNVGDGQDEVVACRSLRSCPPLNRCFLKGAVSGLESTGRLANGCGLCSIPNYFHYPFPLFELIPLFTN